MVQKGGHTMGSISGGGYDNYYPFLIFLILILLILGGIGIKY